MKQLIFSKANIQNPLVDPSGETVYELIGNSTPVSFDSDQNTPGTEPTLLPNHSLAQITIAPGGSSKPHYHKNCQESYYVLSGKAIMRLDGENFILEPGQACLVVPGQIHQIINQEAQTLEFLAVCVPAWFPDDSVYL